MPAAKQEAAGGPAGPLAVGVGTMPDLLALTNAIRDTRTQMLQKKIDRARAPRMSIWASQIPECARQGVYEFTHWDQKKLWDPVAQARIDVGHYVEDATLQELRDIGKLAGFKIVDEQANLSAELHDEGIHGRTDCRIEVSETRQRFPTEIKKVGAYIFDKIRDGSEGLEDMRDIWFMRKYVRQLMMNIVGHKTDRGMFILVSPDSGAWKLIPVALDVVEADWSRTMAKTIKAAVDAKTLPDRIDFDGDICGKCSFLAICIPDIQNNTKLRFSNSAELESDIEELKQLEPYKRRYDALWKKLKGMMEGVSDTISVNGRFNMFNKMGLTTKYKVPDEVKATYAVKEPTATLKVEVMGDAVEAA